MVLYTVLVRGHSGFSVIYINGEPSVGSYELYPHPLVVNNIVHNEILVVYEYIIKTSAVRS